MIDIVKNVFGIDKIINSNFKQILTLQSFMALMMWHAVGMLVKCPIGRRAHLRLGELMPYEIMQNQSAHL